MRTRHRSSTVAAAILAVLTFTTNIQVVYSFVDILVQPLLLNAESHSRVGRLVSTTMETTASTETSAMTSSSSPPPSLSALEKLTALRKKMKEMDVHVYLVPSVDPHFSGTYICTNVYIPTTPSSSI